MITTAAVLPLIFFIYQIIIDWIDLFPWNDIKRKSSKLKLQEFLINYIPLLLISYAYLHPSNTTFVWGMIGSLLYFTGHIIAWWIPYLFGASQKQQAEYNTYFKHTYKFLPPIKNNPVPDAEHVVLGLICLVMTVLNIAVFFSYK